MVADVESFLKENAWIAVPFLLLVTVFRDSLKTLFTRALNAAGTAIYNRLAGSRLLRKRALSKYRTGLVRATEKIAIPFRPNRPLILDDIYVSLRLAADDSGQPQNAHDLLSAHPHLVVTGPPGSGKSMLLRHLAANHARASQGVVSPGAIPVLLELHRLSRPAKKGTEIEHYLVDAFERYGFPKADKFVTSALEKGWLLLLLDGFDEVPTVQRADTAARIRDFLERIRSCPVVITCRTAVYRNEFEVVTQYQAELEPFQDQQIQAFLSAWTDPMPAEKSPAQLMAALREQPQLLTAARNPLLLTIITHLYSENPTYVLPRSRAEFYRQAASILLEQWQEHLHHNSFDGAEKKAVLASVAIHLQQAGASASEDRRTISREDVISRIGDVLPNLGRHASQAPDMLVEIVERSGLLLPVDGGARYTFAHLTFQEYFAAEAQLNHPETLLTHFQEDPDTWREVIILWCGLVADSTSAIRSVYERDRLTALACVAEANSVDSSAAERILRPALDDVITGKADETLQRAIGAVAADIRPRGAQVLQSLVDAFIHAQGIQREVIAVALATSNQPRAADAIVDAIVRDPDLAPSVVRLGDLAVPGLKSLIFQQESRLAVECLAKIATPSASVALAEIMMRPSSNRAAAAWGLSSTLGNPLVVSELSKYAEGLHHPQLHTSYGWIWKPFDEASHTSIAGLIGVAAEQMLSSDPVDAVAKPDPRIATALCAHEPCPLDTAIERQPGTERLVEIANEFTSQVKFEFLGSKLHTKGDDSPKRSELPFISFSGKKPILSYRSFLENLNSDLGSSTRIRLREIRGADPKDLRDRWMDGLDAIGESLPRALGLPIWGELLSSLPENLRRVFLIQMTRPGKVTRETWSAVAAATSYTFERSRWYGAILVVACTATTTALFQAGRMIFTDFGSNTSLLAIAAAMMVLGSWYWLQQDRPLGKPLAGIEPENLAITLIGPLLILVFVGDWILSRRDDRANLPLDVTPLVLGGFLPSLCWLNLELINGSLLFSVALVGGAILLCVLLSIVGVWIEHRRRMPLAGLFTVDRAQGELLFPLMVSGPVSTYVTEDHLG